MKGRFADSRKITFCDAGEPVNLDTITVHLDTVPIGVLMTTQGTVVVVVVVASVVVADIGI